MKKIIRYVLTYIYSLYLKNKNIFLAPSSIITKKTIFEGRNKINKKCFIPNSRIGKGTYIGSNSMLPNVRIGKYCSIAANVKVLPYTHPTNTFVSTHPCFFSTLKQAGFSYTSETLFDETSYVDPVNEITVLIGNDVWIGEDVKILGGVKIGDGAIVAAGAIVTKDVASYSIVGGVPAKHLKYRFTQEEIDFLKNIKWWEQSEYWLKENVLLFKDIEKMTQILNVNR